MGYDVNRFQGDVDEELICSICSGVLEEPVQVPICEHAFCSACILEWLNHQATCPVDRQSITSSQLKPVPRILKNLLSRLTINCTNANFGCGSFVKLDVLNQHLSECEHNPRRPVHCELGCGLIIPLDEVGQHNCVRELHGIIQSQGDQIQDLKEQVQDFQRQIVELKQQVTVVTDIMQSFRMSANNLSLVSPRRNFVDTTDEVQQWLLALPPARVTRWGGMISTPDAVLQAVIRRSLADSGCPQYILDDLMENAHERRWSQGLSTLETRQMNRRRYEQYLARRIPGKQAVVVMACENRHMGEFMVMEPGIVMIFAHGIE
ncbi:E3 ubiquitin-protein ligase NRDP1-like [Hydractinia symbiolongicarpus]|uniref:E3 ubiquitin-protein ligase NRDP1-like n=1 Tax=Hydractinia symbiolongicarpus TaxID=13093 RepID=UPI00255142F0|nr:E3 ubiquitin-protein ligase NRDP1-like [Hydractinia symbiolongicarpus]